MIPMVKFNFGTAEAMVRPTALFSFEISMVLKSPFTRLFETCASILV